jgi:hypothetical protein
MSTLTWDVLKKLAHKHLMSQEALEKISGGFVANTIGQKTLGIESMLRKK